MARLAAGTERARDYRESSRVVTIRRAASGGRELVEAALEVVSGGR
jgi:hypothetical protein